MRMDELGTVDDDFDADPPSADDVAVTEFSAEMSQIRIVKSL